jgi:fido (protein-threonine AMPylation protein)
LSDTELKLKFWRGDQIGAERLAATILHIDGFSSVDPQSPLGGPDGLKDLLCEKNGWRYIAAAYFPTTDKKFNSIQEKFKHDLAGVAANSANGIVFLTNQSITPSQRDELSELAEGVGHKSILYHLERLRALLDSPTGYGARLEFLDIDMSREEQLSFFSQWNRSFSDELQSHSLMIIRELSKKIDALAGSTERFGAQVAEISNVVQQTRSVIENFNPPSNKKDFILRSHDFATNELTVNDLCMLHRALLFDAPSGVQVGAIRNTKIWIGGVGSTPNNAAFVPPNPELVPDLLEALLSEWRNSFQQLTTASEPEKLNAIAKFHHKFLSIHPFIDGNGRIARFLLTQHARELLNQKLRVFIDDKPPYFRALTEADRGNYLPLEEQITQAIFGVEFIPGSPCQMSRQQCPGCREGHMNVNSDETGVVCPACGLFIPAIEP